MRAPTTVQNLIQWYDVCQIDASTENLRSSSRAFSTLDFIPSFYIVSHICCTRSFERCTNVRFNVEIKYDENRGERSRSRYRETIIWIINVCIYWCIRCCFTKQNAPEIYQRDFAPQTECVYVQFLEYCKNIVYRFLSFRRLAVHVKRIERNVVGKSKELSESFFDEQSSW